MRYPVISDAVGYSKFALALRGFLREKITLEQSKQMVSDRLRDRETNFLSVVRRAVFDNPESPYLKLLRNAGCEFGDVEASAGRQGIEATLNDLLEAGVYVTWDEFKGRSPAIRGGNSFHFEENDFDNPLLSGSLYVQSSGTSGAATRTMFDLGHLEQMSYYYNLVFAAGNALDYPRGLWRAGFPSGAGMVDMLFSWKADRPVAKWFVPVTDRETRASIRDRLATKYFILGSRFWSPNPLKPEYVGLEGAARVARWMSDTVRRSGGCSLSSFVSPAVKVCQAARSNDLDMQGAHFSVGGEPLTEAKRRQIQEAGATVTLRYAVTEIGYVGCGCPQGRTTDDVHVFLDAVALIQHRREVEHTGTDVNAFLFTTLLPTAPKILLNAGNDDCGDIETRSCDCLFGELGFNKHVHGIRSYSKLTGSGMTVAGADLARILEEVLPAKYGGAPTDYQLLEEEDSRGHTSLNLIVSPDVGGIDERDVVETVLQELRGGPRGNRLAAAFWSQLHAIQIRREYPLTSTGKISTLHSAKKR